MNASHEGAAFLFNTVAPCRAVACRLQDDGKALSARATRALVCIGIGVDGDASVHPSVVSGCERLAGKHLTGAVACTGLKDRKAA